MKNAQPTATWYCVTLKNIVWDMECNDVDFDQEDEGLPNEFIIEVEALNEEQAEEFAIGLASDEYGFCIQDCEVNFA